MSLLIDNLQRKKQKTHDYDERRTLQRAQLGLTGYRYLIDFAVKTIDEARFDDLESMKGALEDILEEAEKKCDMLDDLDKMELDGDSYEEEQ